jgi:hypothetical protein
VTLLATGAWTEGLTKLWGVTARIGVRAEHVLEADMGSLLDGASGVHFSLVGDVLGSSFATREPDAQRVARELEEHAARFVGPVRPRAPGLPPAAVARRPAARRAPRRRDVRLCRPRRVGDLGRPGDGADGRRRHPWRRGPARGVRPAPGRRNSPGCGALTHACTPLAILTRHPRARSGERRRRRAPSAPAPDGQCDRSGCAAPAIAFTAELGERT